MCKYCRHCLPAIQLSLGWGLPAVPRLTQFSCYNQWMVTIISKAQVYEASTKVTQRYIVYPHKLFWARVTLVVVATSKFANKGLRASFRITQKNKKKHLFQAAAPLDRVKS